MLQGLRPEAASLAPKKFLTVNGSADVSRCNAVLSYLMVTTNRLELPSLEFDLEIIETANARLRAALMGTGPLVVLIHGFPEGWY
jgi:hypothetical protein